MFEAQELKNRFTHHPPSAAQIEKYQRIRDEAHGLAEIIVDESPPSREQSLALTNLEQAVMWANAAIARRS